ncbi:MAG: HD domain-containing protein [Lachnospiraceae bacterium]|nr:HD domain-containing protein [Lachnospiraceae bacterium]
MSVLGAEFGEGDEFIRKILKHPVFTRELRLIEGSERTREFCKHDITHLLDVARIAYIICLEKKLDIPKYAVYAAALLHDIGRGREYTDGTPHELAGIRLAMIVLEDIGLEEEDIRLISDAIGNHRDVNVTANDDLAGILYTADKLSRRCYRCDAYDNCNWEESKRNETIVY